VTRKSRLEPHVAAQMTAGAWLVAALLVCTALLYVVSIVR
jgi:CHASE3 domain sensor protein